MSWAETRKAMLQRLFDARTAEEAERYKDKQMDEPTPPYGCNRTRSDFSVGDPVKMKLDPDSAVGMVVEIVYGAGGFSYNVSWSDSRTMERHYGIELIHAPAAELPDSV